MAAQQLRHPAAGHADVLHPRDACLLERPVRLAPRLAQPVGFGRVRRTDDGRRAGGLGCGRGGIELGLGGGSAGVGLDHQHRARVLLEPHPQRRVDRSDREVVEELEGHRHEPAAGHPGDRVARGGDGREERQHRQLGCRHRTQPQGRLGDDPERPLRPDEQVRQVVAHDVLRVPSAGADDRAIGEHDLEAEDVVARDAVLHAAQPARVLGQVAADRADLVARRVGRVEEPVLGDRAPEVRR